jgi:hypothetical protein
VEEEKKKRRKSRLKALKVAFPRVEFCRQRVERVGDLIRTSQKEETMQEKAARE